METAIALIFISDVDDDTNDSGYDNTEAPKTKKSANEIKNEFGIMMGDLHPRASKVRYMNVVVKTSAN